MPTSIREQALQAWAQEQQRQAQSEQKKRKRRAKRIEADIDDLLPRTLENPKYERILEDGDFGVMVSVGDRDGDLRFTYDDGDNLVLISTCGNCRRETVSKPVRRLEDLGAMIDRFEPGDSHSCSK